MKASRWARTRSKMLGVNIFLSFYSVILKLGTKEKLAIPKNPMFFVFDILAFFAGK